MQREQKIESKSKLTGGSERVNLIPKLVLNRGKITNQVCGGGGGRISNIYKDFDI